MQDYKLLRVVAKISATLVDPKLVFTSWPSLVNIQMHRQTAFDQFIW